MIKREHIEAIRRRAGRFAEATGRRPRILMARVNEKELDPEMKAVAASLADAGFDVDILGALQSPEAAARIAVENDAHVLGVVGISAGTSSLIKDVTWALKAAGGQEIRVAAWRRFSPQSIEPTLVMGDESAGVIELTGDLIRSAERLMDALTTRS